METDRPTITVHRVTPRHSLRFRWRLWRLKRRRRRLYRKLSPVGRELAAELELELDRKFLHG